MFYKGEGVTVMGVPISTEKYVAQRTLGAWEDGDADRQARCLVNMPGKQTVAHRTPRAEGAFFGYEFVCPFKHAGGQTTGRSELKK